MRGTRGTQAAIRTTDPGERLVAPPRFHRAPKRPAAHWQRRGRTAATTYRGDGRLAGVQGADRLRTRRTGVDPSRWPRASRSASPGVTTIQRRRIGYAGGAYPTMSPRNMPPDATSGRRRRPDPCVNMTATPNGTGRPRFDASALGAAGNGRHVPAVHPTNGSPDRRRGLYDTVAVCRAGSTVSSARSREAVPRSAECGGAGAEGRRAPRDTTEQTGTTTPRNAIAIGATGRSLGSDHRGGNG